MRLFTAIEPPPDVRKHLSRVAEACAEHCHGVRWTPAENLHLTLKFIGEIPDERVPDVTRALDQLMIERPMELRCGRLVCFPPRGPARIIAAEVTGDVEPLSIVFDEIEDALTGVCLKEPRRYTPHITLGRSKAGVAPRVREVIGIETQDRFPGPVFEADEVVLFCSDLGKTGPTYTPVAHF